MHRRHEMEARINIFVDKCEHAIQDIKKLQMQTQGFVGHLNCEPSELKERFLNCMKQLDEYTYLITDFNLAMRKLDSTNSIDYTPVHDVPNCSILPQPPVGAFNLIDALSEPTPSTSKAHTPCCNQYPSEKPLRKKKIKEDQPLIAFSSTSCSSESVPMSRSEKEVQCQIIEETKCLTLDDSGPMLDECKLPAQTLLQIDQIYPATIMHVDGLSFWVIANDFDDVLTLMTEMTSYYKENTTALKLDEVMTLTYCTYYAEDSDCFYRGLFIRLTEEDMSLAEVFLVDTGETRCAPIETIQPLAPRFCKKPPFARCCHLAGIDLLGYRSKDLLKKQEMFVLDFIGERCNIKIDDNSSESLDVYVILETGDTLNELLVRHGLALRLDKSNVSAEGARGLPELDEENFDITQCPEYEDPLVAVTGYHNRDEKDICKHYKGGPEKTCFKGDRCTKRHVVMHPADQNSLLDIHLLRQVPVHQFPNLLHPATSHHNNSYVASPPWWALHTALIDGWTLDQVPVVAKCRPLPLPAPGTWHRVYVTHVAHFDRLYVHFLTDENNECESSPSFGVVLPPTTLNALVLDMNSPATRMAYKPLQMTPAPGELVAALYPLDEQWYRARVVSATRADQSVEVMYIDYGNVAWVKEDAVRALAPRFCALAAQAARCALGGVAPRAADSRAWAAARAALAALAHERRLQARVLARDYDEVTVELFDDEGNNIAEQLAASNLVTLTECSVIDDTDVQQKIIVP